MKKLEKSEKYNFLVLGKQNSFTPVQRQLKPMIRISVLAIKNGITFFQRMKSQLRQLTKVVRESKLNNR